MSKSKFSKSSQTWLREHASDHYVKQAQHAGYRSRSVYKLAQIDAQDQLIRAGMNIIDLGAAPGGWSQWAAQKVNNQINIIALDLLPMNPLVGVTCIQGDFREPQTLELLLNHLNGKKANLVMSDMSPNITGMKDVDQPRALLLAELARELAYEVLTVHGHFLTKVFQGEGFNDYVSSLKSHFKQVIIRKPDASRSRSAEVYVVAKHYLT